MQSNSEASIGHSPPPNSTLAPIEMSELSKYMNFNGLSDHVAKNCKLAIATVLKGGGNQKVAPDLAFAIVLTKSGEVYTYGRDLDGMLGNGGDVEFRKHGMHWSRDPIPDSAKVGWNKIEELCDKDIVDIYAPSFQSMCFAITKSGCVYSWGLNDNKQLGHSWGKEVVNTPTRIDLDPIHKIKELVTTKYQTYALTTKGEVFTWGRAWTGKFGTIRQVCTPNFQVLSNIKTIEGGFGYFCALSNDGDVYALKQKDSTMGTCYHVKRMQMDLNNEVRVKEISCGHKHVLALAEDGRIFGWGINRDYQLNDTKDPEYCDPVSLANNFKPSPTPHNVKGIAAFVNMSCCELESGDIYLWGLVVDPKERVENRRAPFIVQGCRDLQDIILRNYYPYITWKPLVGKGVVQNGIEDKGGEGSVISCAGPSSSSGPSAIPTIEGGNSERASCSSQSLRSRKRSISSESSYSTESLSSEKCKIGMKRRASSNDTGISLSLRKRPGSPWGKNVVWKRQKKSQDTDPGKSIANPPQPGPERPKIIQKSPAIEQTQLSTSNSIPDMLTYYSNLDLSDVKFKFEGVTIEIFTATLKYLRDKYPYFREKFTDTNEVIIENITLKAFSEFLNFVNNDKMNFQNDDWEDLLSLLKFVNEPTINDTEIKTKCEDLFFVMVVENPLEIYIDCREIDYEVGYNLAFNYICEHLEEFCPTRLLEISDTFRQYREHWMILNVLIADLRRQRNNFWI